MNEGLLPIAGSAAQVILLPSTAHVQYWCTWWHKGSALSPLLGQLRRLTPSPDVPVGTAEVSIETATQINLSIYLILLPSSPPLLFPSLLPQMSVPKAFPNKLIPNLCVSCVPKLNTVTEAGNGKGSQMQSSPSRSSRGPICVCAWLFGRWRLRVKLWSLK